MSACNSKIPLCRVSTASQISYHRCRLLLTDRQNQPVNIEPIWKRLQKRHRQHGHGWLAKNCVYTFANTCSHLHTAVIHTQNQRLAIHILRVAVYSKIRILHNVLSNPIRNLMCKTSDWRLVERQGDVTKFGKESYRHCLYNCKVGMVCGVGGFQSYFTIWQAVVMEYTGSSTPDCKTGVRLVPKSLPTYCTHHSSSGLLNNGNKEGNSPFTYMLEFPATRHSNTKFILIQLQASK